MAKRWLTPEGMAWLRRNYSKHPIALTCELYDVHFGYLPTVGQMKSANNNHHFGVARRRGQQFSPDETRFLKLKLRRKLPHPRVRAEFAARFGRTLKKSTLGLFVRRNGLKGTPNAGWFMKGHVPHNKGRKGHAPPGSEKTWFSKENVPANKRPLFAERWSKHSHGQKVLEINVSVRNPYTGFSNHWVRKARWVWMQAHGEIPEGHAIVQLDGDPGNCELDNLECVPKAVLARLNGPGSPGWAGFESNPARVRLAQLKTAVSTRVKEGARG